MQRGKQVPIRQYKPYHISFTSKCTLLPFHSSFHNIWSSSSWTWEPSPPSFSSFSFHKIPTLPSPENARFTSPTTWTTCTTTRKTMVGKNGARNPHPRSHLPIWTRWIPRRSKMSWRSATPDPSSDSSSSELGFAGLRWENSLLPSFCFLNLSSNLS